MSQQTLNRLRELRLGGMAAALQQQQEQVATYDGLSFIERLGLLVEQEHLAREQRKQARLVRHARLKLSATTQESTTSTRATSTEPRSPGWPRAGAGGSRRCAPCLKPACCGSPADRAG